MYCMYNLARRRGYLNDNEPVIYTDWKTVWDVRKVFLRGEIYTKVEEAGAGGGAGGGATHESTD